MIDDDDDENGSVLERTVWREKGASLVGYCVLKRVQTFARASEWALACEWNGNNRQQTKSICLPER